MRIKGDKFLIGEHVFEFVSYDPGSSNPSREAFDPLPIEVMHRAMMLL